jgi:hypothetical protein
MNRYPFTEVLVAQTFVPLERAIQWMLDPGFSDIGPFRFSVEAAEDQAFGRLLYVLDAGTGFHVIDRTRLRQGQTIDLIYRVRLRTGSGAEHVSEPILYLGGRQNRHQLQVAREIMRKEFVRMRYTGLSGWLLKRRNYGMRLPENLDPVTGVPLTDRSSDFGTGYEGGYYPAIRVTYSVEDGETEVRLHPEGAGTTASEQASHRYAGFPLLEPQDILVNKVNHRYRYSTVKTTVMPATAIAVVQQCGGALLPPTDPAYRLPVPPEDVPPL